ncbi:type III secretion system (T3SS) SseB-like protein [Actinomadura pelletieri DSM 43383]|uniref:Type III secretion system (T3SS) SseB-like protein n=1 Tax=Actinomadura pelletieri DSM 43383 TaxID=1120940 RepID=A0A495QNH8_9ACTN|nr:SseB family protein [Actinomadura pelletieri]RKS74535.1 type III secretion system (T3SS) SseB-like protein [Actinomadura pelletieri DSM 43383]
MPGLTIPEPQFPDDDGTADPRLCEALAGYAAGRVAAHTVLRRLRGVRLLVPIVAVLTEEEETPPGGLRREKSSDMALPTLIGDDGRRGVLGFTCVETMKAWRADARPVAVRASEACRATLDEGADALVVDVAGPVPFAVDGMRLHMLAEGRPVPPPHEDPDVLAAVEAAFGTDQAVSGVRVSEGESTELAVRFSIVPGHDERRTVQRVSDRLAELLRGHIVGGVELSVTRRA